MTATDRPRLLLVPQVTELEWVIAPLLSEWAEVASFDAPGVGEEPPVPSFGPATIAERGLAEVDRRGWRSFVLLADEFGVPAALALAERRPEAIEALAFGHARLSNSLDGSEPAINREVFEACGHLARNDPKTLVRQAMKMTGGEEREGGYGDDLADRFLERVPLSLYASYYADSTAGRGAGIGEQLAALGVPMLLAEHRGCLMFTAEGYRQAVARFPDAETVSVKHKPSVSSEFAGALRSFCLAHRTAPTL